MILLVSRDFNGHIRMNANGYKEVHDGRGFERLDVEGERILEFAVAHKLAASNCFFTKSGSKAN